LFWEWKIDSFNDGIIVPNGNSMILSDIMKSVQYFMMSRQLCQFFSISFCSICRKQTSALICMNDHSRYIFSFPALNHVLPGLRRNIFLFKSWPQRYNWHKVLIFHPKLPSEESFALILTPLLPICLRKPSEWMTPPSEFTNCFLADHLLQKIDYPTPNDQSEKVRRDSHESLTFLSRTSFWIRDWVRPSWSKSQRSFYWTSIRCQFQYRSRL
jgi:hypothetical protein